MEIKPKKWQRTVVHVLGRVGARRPQVGRLEAVVDGVLGAHCERVVVHWEQVAAQREHLRHVLRFGCAPDTDADMTLLLASSSGDECTRQ